MSHFCAIEKAIIKRVKLLTNIHGDSPYTFFPRNFCHLMYSKYIYAHHVSCKHTHSHIYIIAGNVTSLLQQKAPSHFT